MRTKFLSRRGVSAAPIFFDLTKRPIQVARPERRRNANPIWRCMGININTPWRCSVAYAHRGTRPGAIARRRSRNARYRNKRIADAGNVAAVINWAAGTA